MNNVGIEDILLGMIAAMLDMQADAFSKHTTEIDIHSGEILMHFPDSGNYYRIRVERETKPPTGSQK